VYQNEIEMGMRIKLWTARNSNDYTTKNQSGVEAAGASSILGWPGL